MNTCFLYLKWQNHPKENSKEAKDHRKEKKNDRHTNHW